jgi:preprotein translocase SecE subunit
MHVLVQEAGVVKGDGLTDEERGKLEALKKVRAQPKEPDNIVSAVLSELQYIEWPKPGQAAVDTGVVIAIVIGSSAFLFALNGVLTEVSKVLFSLK